MRRSWPYWLAALIGCGLLIGHPGTPPGVRRAVEGAWLLALATAAAYKLWTTLRGQLHLLRARLGLPTSRAPTHYVRRLFDNYAGHYDRHLVEELAYAGPDLLRDLVGDRLGGRRADVADLGCGTGILAPLLRPLARHLVGVDLSPGMLQLARSRGLYDELVEAEVVAFLESRPAEHDLLLACDLLVYLGDLTPFLAGAATALREGGYLAMTTEHMPDGTYRLLPSGRFAHAPAHVLEIAGSAGLALVEQRQAPLRQESGRPIIADLFLFRRPAASGAVDPGRE